MIKTIKTIAKDFAIMTVPIVIVIYWLDHTGRHWPLWVVVLIGMVTGIAADRLRSWLWEPVVQSSSVPVEDRTMSYFDGYLVLDNARKYLYRKGRLSTAAEEIIDTAEQDVADAVLSTDGWGAKS